MKIFFDVWFFSIEFNLLHLFFDLFRFCFHFRSVWTGPRVCRYDTCVAMKLVLLWYLCCYNTTGTCWITSRWAAWNAKTTDRTRRSGRSSLLTTHSTTHILGPTLGSRASTGWVPSLHPHPHPQPHPQAYLGFQGITRVSPIPNTHTHTHTHEPTSGSRQGIKRASTIPPHTPTPAPAPTRLL